MDLDAFALVHGPTWARLRELTRTRRLTGAEADELVALYQTVATHLSAVRSAAPDPALVSELSEHLAAARARITGAHDSSWSHVARFALVVVPAAMYRIRWWTVGVMLGFVGLGTLSGVWTASNPAALEALGPPEQRRQYAEEAFESYYSEYAHGSFATLVWTNNAWVALLCIAFGVTGILTVFVLVQNALAVGGAGAIMAEHDALDVFFALILPHGQLELTAIFVAGAAGLRLFWAMVVPGDLPRERAMAREGRGLIGIALGLVGVLAVSGVVEGFVTPSSLPWWLKIAIGTLTLVAFWVYVLVLGRAAVRDGETGDVHRDDREDVLPVAA